EIGELLIARHVARCNEWVLQRRRELADVFLEALARIRQREARARRGGGLRDRPRDRSLVGDADDQSLFSRKIRQGLLRTFASGRTVTSRHARRRGLWRSAAAGTHAAARRTARDVAVRAVAELLLRAAPLMTRT